MPSSAAIRTVIVRDFARLESLRPAWDALWKADPEAEIFQTFAWARAWWGAFGPQVELCSPVVYEGEEVIGILPLVKREGRMMFLGHPQADYQDIVCWEDRTEEILACCIEALRAAPGWREGFLDGLSERSRVVRHWSATPGLRSNMFLVPSDLCYTIRLNVSAEQTLDHLANKPHLRRRQNKLDKAGQVRFRHMDSIAEALDHLEIFFRSQKRRRLLHGKSSATDQPEFRQFLQNLVEEMGLQQELRIGVLELDGRPLAWHLSFVTNQKLLFYQQTFDVDAWDLAPGEVLLRQLLLYAKGRVSREFDFGRGDEPFKARFSNHRSALFTLYLEPANVRGAARGLWRRIQARIDVVWGRVRGLLKSEKWMFEFVRSLRAKAAGMLLRGSQLRRKSSGMAGLVGAVVVAAGRSVWKRESVSVFRMVPRRENRLPSMDSPQTRRGVRVGTMGDLVDFAHEHPACVLATEILKFRDRLRQGDRAFVQWNGDHPVRVAWAGTRSMSELLELPGAAGPDEPALTVYDVWDGDMEHAVSLEALMDTMENEAAAQHLPLRVCSRTPSSALLAEVRSRPFIEDFQIRTWELCGSVVHLSVCKGGSNGAQ